jgi:hypothetical protein
LLFRHGISDDRRDCMKELLVTRDQKSANRWDDSLEKRAPVREPQPDESDDTEPVPPRRDPEPREIPIREDSAAPPLFWLARRSSAAW